MANFKPSEVRKGLVFKFQGKLFRVTDFPTRVSVVGKNITDSSPSEVKIPIDRLKKPDEIVRPRAD